MEKGRKKDSLEEKVAKDRSGREVKEEALNYDSEIEVLNNLVQKQARNVGFSDEERNFIEKSSVLNDFQKKQILINDKIIKGEELTFNEKKFLNEISSRENFNFGDFYSNEVHQNFLRKAENLKKKGGKKIFHWTDTHLRIDDLETKLNLLKTLNMFDVKEDIFVNTGDILEDFIQPRNLKSLVGTRIIKEGRLNKNQAEEFKKAYEILLKTTGLTELDLETGGALLGERGEYQLNKFLTYLFTESEPEFLTREELKRFREAKEKVLENLGYAIKNHAKNYYSKVKEIFEKNGFSPKNTLLVAGNHDVEEVMWEVLGEYMIAPGQVKEVQGKRFGNLISGSTGDFLGTYLSDILAWKDINKDPKIVYNTEAFKKLKSKLYEVGFVDITNENLILAIKHAKKKEAMGISNSELIKYFNKYIKPEVDLTVQREINKIPYIDPKGVDYFVGHGDPSSDFAGVEEKKVLELLKGSSAKYLHGHIHEPTSHKEKGIYFLNPGTGKNLNYGLYLDYDENFEVLFGELNQVNRNLEYKHMDLESLISSDEKNN